MSDRKPSVGITFYKGLKKKVEAELISVQVLRSILEYGVETRVESGSNNVKPLSVSSNGNQ